MTTPVLTSAQSVLKIGSVAPDCLLPDGGRLFDLRGKPVVLAFAIDEWNPATAYQSEIFWRLANDFGDATFIDTATSEWHSCDNRSDLAKRFGAEGRRALFLMDEKGIIRWKIDVENGREIRTGQILAALEDLKQSVAKAGEPVRLGDLSRRTFLTATLAAAAILMLPRFSVKAAPEMDEVRGNHDATDTIPVTLEINGKSHRLQLESRVALLDALRENLHLTGTKKGCDHGQCGACTVHIDGQSALSCLTLAVMVQGKKITTIEGIADGDVLHPLQTSFIKHDAFQCGYCTPGQIMAATALLKDKKSRSDAEIREAMSGNLCRCAAYPNIIAAIKEVQTA